MNAFKRNVLLGFGVLVLVLLAVAAVSHYRARWAVVRYQRQLQAAGEKLKIEGLIPMPPMPESNGAPFFSQAVGAFSWNGTNLLNKNAPAPMMMVAPGKAMVGWAQPDVRVDGTNTWQEVAAALKQYQAGLDLVRTAAQCPVWDFRLDYRQGFTLLLPHLAPEKRAVQLLGTVALCDLHQGDAAGAATNIEATLAIVNATTREGLVISQLVRIAMAYLSLADTWELLQATNLNDAELAELQHDWAGLSFAQPMDEAIEMERAMHEMLIERMRNSSAQFRQVLPFGGGSGSLANPTVSFGKMGDEILGEIVTGTREARWRLTQSYPDELRMLKGSQVLIEGLRWFEAGQPFTNVASGQNQRLASLGLEITNSQSGGTYNGADVDLSSLFSEGVVSMSRVLYRVFFIEAGRRMTVTALALKRYQLRHSQYPPDLAALVPDFLPAVPRDPADGEPLRYRLRSNGTFLLYSVGEDGVDNGGDPSPVTASDYTFGWNRGRDFVWPQPAAPAEVGVYQQQKQMKKHGR